MPLVAVPAWARKVPHLPGRATPGRRRRLTRRRVVPHARPRRPRRPARPLSAPSRTQDWRRWQLARDLLIGCLDRERQGVTSRYTRGRGNRRGGRGGKAGGACEGPRRRRGVEEAR